MKYTDENDEKYGSQSVPVHEISRRELLRRTGRGALGLALGSLLMNQPTDASAARLKRMLPAATVLPRAAAQGTVGTTPTLQMPYWGDGTTLDQPQFYLTIQAGRRLQINKTVQSADIDGDGQDELLARTPNGIILHHFDPASGQWDPMQVNGPPLRDADGWSGPAYYETIQTADINNDGKAEIIARGGDGIHVWKYIPAEPDKEKPAYFEELAPGSEWPAWNDAYGWDQPQCYQTIQCADIDGDGQVELLGRAPNNDPNGAGMQVWRYGASGWTKLSSVNAPLADAQGWYLPQYYRTIQCASVRSKSKPSLLARGKDGIQIWDYDNSSGWTISSTTGPIPFSDAQGWTGPAYYNTIQCAYLDGLDADGKGQAALIGRGGNGIEVWQYQNDQWINRATGPAWADQYGWNQAPYYLTIQLADIDGDGRDELLGRAPNLDPNGKGMQAWQWTGTAWNRLAMGPAWNDRSPNFDDDSNDHQTSWYDAQYCLTIQTARVLGDSQAEDPAHKPPIFPNPNNPSPQNGKAYAALLGRGFFSVQTWRYLPGAGDSGTDKWTQTSAPFPKFSDGERLTAYRYIRDSEVFNGNDPREVYPTLDDPGTKLASLQDLYQDGPPSGVSQADWNTVYYQIRHELENLNTLVIMNNDFVQNLITDAFLESSGPGILNQVHNNLYATIPRAPTGSGNTIFFTILEIVASSAWALSALAAPEVAPLTAALLSAGTGLLSSASIGLSLVPQNDQHAKNYDSSKLSQMEQDIITAAESAVTASAYATATAAQDWGLLQAQGRLDQTPSNARVAALRGYRLYAYQKLAPLYWRRGSVNFQDLRMFATERDTDSTYQHPFKRLYEYGRYYQPPTNPAQRYFLSVIKHTIRAEYESDSHPCDAAVYPNSTAFEEIFGALDDHNEHLLGASYEDVLLSNKGAGWDLSGGWFYTNRIHTGATFEGLDDGNDEALPPGPGPKPPLNEGVSVETTATLAREPDTGDILVTVNFRNAGTRKLSNMALVDTRLGSMSIRPHARMTRLYGDKSETVQVRFPASVGASGLKTVLRIVGEHREGTFGGTYRVTLP